MKAKRLSSAILSCTFLSMACSTGPNSADAASVAVEVTSVDTTLGRVSGIVHNTGDVALWFGGCMAGVESLQDGTWKSVYGTRVCKQYLGELPPGHSVDFVAELPEPGTACPLRASAGLTAFFNQPDEKSVAGHSSVFCRET